ncbi:MAG: hypothetical protein HY602_01260 [Parcubacteria group bacterium]|nr:hypothetical protein [Parcubacteria group bacterium]
METVLFGMALFIVFAMITSPVIYVRYFERRLKEEREREEMERAIEESRKARLEAQNVQDKLWASYPQVTGDLRKSVTDGGKITRLAAFIRYSETNAAIGRWYFIDIYYDQKSMTHKRRLKDFIGIFKKVTFPMSDKLKETQEDTVPVKYLKFE